MKKLSIKKLLLLLKKNSPILFIPNLIFAIEIKIKNETENWIYSSDRINIFENNLSARMFTKNFNAGIEILYLHKDTSVISFKKDIEINEGIFNLILGDFTYIIGEGLCLGMQSIPFRDIERRILGTKLELKPKFIKLAGMIGKPKIIERTNKDYIVLNDTNNIITSFNVYNNLFSVNGTKIISEDSLHTNLIGGSYKFNSSLFSIYTEGVKKFGFDKIYYERNTGYGIYSNLSIFIGSYIFNVKLQKYDKLGVGDFSYRYNLFPTINSFNYSINDGVDEEGFQLELKKSIKNLWINGFHSQLFTADTDDDKKFIENYLKFELEDYSLTIKYLLQNNTGINKAFIKNNEIYFEIYYPIENVENTIEIKKADVITYLRDTTTFFDINFRSNLQIKDNFILYYNYIWRDKKIIEDSPDRKWFGLGARYELSGKIFFDFYIGKEKGGLLCYGGICRWINPFEGIKLKLTLSI